MIQKCSCDECIRSPQSQGPISQYMARDSPFYSSAPPNFCNDINCVSCIPLTPPLTPQHQEYYHPNSYYNIPQPQPQLEMYNNYFNYPSPPPPQRIEYSVLSQFRPLSPNGYNDYGPSWHGNMTKMGGEFVDEYGIPGYPLCVDGNILNRQ